jgi:hypothetical protein
MMFFSIFFWIPAAIYWILASRNVEKDMSFKSRILSERKQLSLIDYIFELEVQMDRAIQKVQDSKYYIKDNETKFNKLLDEALHIFKFCEREGVSRSITNIEKKAHIMYLKVLLIKHEANKLFDKRKQPEISTDEKKNIMRDLRQIYVRISEWEKSTFGEIQTYYEDAYLKILEARLNRKQHLFNSLRSISESIKIYERVKYLINERLEIVTEKNKLSEEETIIRDKEEELLDKCSKSLNATIKLKEEIENTLNQLNEHGVENEDILKISDLALEYDVDLYNIIIDTFQQDNKTKKVLIETLDKIDNIFSLYDEWKETELKVF